MRLILTLLFLVKLIGTVRAHGRLIEPPSRSSAWRYGFNTTKNYNDNELYCGGFTRQWNRNKGKCGICGDAYDLPTPRPNELGGKYGSGTIVRSYDSRASNKIKIKVQITAYHRGFFEFNICPQPWDNTQECFDPYPLLLADTMQKRFYPKNGNSIYELDYRLPSKLTECQHCVLQWKYIAGNNWGICSNGTGAVGCGPQEEFRGCADILISTKSKSDTDSQEDIPITSIITLTYIINIILISLIFAIIIFGILFLKYSKFYEKFKTKLENLKLLIRKLLFFGF